MKPLLLAIMLLLTSSCVNTKYVEKQSKALSVSVYAAKDSFDVGRFEYTESYLNEVCRIVIPPSLKDRIKIESITVNKQRRLIIPEKFKDQKIVITGSDEYNALLETKEVAEQLKKDKLTLEHQVVEVNVQLDNQKKVTNEMILRIESDKKIIDAQKHTIFILRMAIGGLIFLAGVLKFFKIL